MSKEDAPNFMSIHTCVMCNHCILQNNHYAPQHRCLKHNFTFLYYEANFSTCDSWEGE